jgi:transposase-like protein
MDESRKKKRCWRPDEITAILRRVLIGREEISEVCEGAGCCPSQVYRWQKQLLDQGAMIFARSNGSVDKRVKAADAKAAKLEAKLGRKAEVLSELMEEHLRLKKSLGEL